MMEQASSRVHAVVRDPAAWKQQGRRCPAVEMRREWERRRAREQQPRCGEVAGGTAAECAAVCCCIPLAALELVVLAAVRSAAAAKKKKETAAEGGKEDWAATARRVPDEAAEAEKEVWARFQGAGFWRSPSQREEKR
jgi:hypothetical protein